MVVGVVGVWVCGWGVSIPAPPSTGSELSLSVFRVILFVYFQPGLSLVVVIVKQYVLSRFQVRDTKLDRLMAN